MPLATCLIDLLDRRAALAMTNSIFNPLDRRGRKRGRQRSNPEKRSLPFTSLYFVNATDANKTCHDDVRTLL